jgi:hypothetical protein
VKVAIPALFQRELDGHVPPDDFSAEHHWPTWSTMPLVIRGKKTMATELHEVVSRRAALRLLIGLGGASVLAACAPPAPSAAPTSVSVTAAAKPAAGSSTPKTGGTLRVAISADPTSLDGQLYAAGRFDTTWLIYDRLTEYDVNLKPA